MTIYWVAGAALRARMVMLYLLVFVKFEGSLYLWNCPRSFFSALKYAFSQVILFCKYCGNDDCLEITN